MEWLASWRARSSTAAKHTRNGRCRPGSARELSSSVPPKPGPAGFKVRKLHYKTAVVDDRTVVAGSFNYTRPANDFNDESIFVIGSAYDEIKKPGRAPIQVDAARCRALAIHVRTELEWILALREVHR